MKKQLTTSRGESSNLRDQLAESNNKLQEQQRAHESALQVLREQLLSKLTSLQVELELAHQRRLDSERDNDDLRERVRSAIHRVQSWRIGSTRLYEYVNIICTGTSYPQHRPIILIGILRIMHLKLLSKVRVLCSYFKLANPLLASSSRTWTRK